MCKAGQKGQEEHVQPGNMVAGEYDATFLWHVLFPCHVDAKKAGEDKACGHCHQTIHAVPAFLPLLCRRVGHLYRKRSGKALVIAARDEPPFRGKAEGVGGNAERLLGKRLDCEQEFCYHLE